MNILIATKSELLALSLASSLSRHTIHLCHSGRDALTQIEAFRPDILLLELGLPEMDGITLLQKSAYKPPVILALSHLVNQSVLEAAAAVGVQKLLLMPCTLSHILEHLNALMIKAPSAEGRSAEGENVTTF